MRAAGAVCLRVAVACAAGAVLAAGDARAQSAPSAQSAQDAAAAEALFEQAKGLMRERRYAEACAKFSESNRLDAGIGTMLWLADCYERNGQSASAWAEFVEAADAAAKRRDERRKVARERAAALEPSLSRLTVSVPPGSDLPALQVTRDGAPVGRVVWGTPVPVDPGTHVLVATAPGYRTWQTSVTVGRGERSGVVTVPTLEAESPSPSQAAAAAGTATPGGSAAAPGSGAPAQAGPTSTPPRALPGSDRRTLGLVTAGIGAAGIAVGSVFGIDAKVRLDASNANNHCSADNRCDETGTAARHEALDAATASTIAFAAGGVLLAAGLGLYFTNPGAPGDTSKRKRGYGLEVRPVVGVHERGVALRARF